MFHKSVTWPGLKKATLGTEAQGSESFDQATENSQWMDKVTLVKIR